MQINRDTWASVPALFRASSSHLDLPVAKDAGFRHIRVYIHQGSADGPQSLAIEVPHSRRLDSNHRMPTLLRYLHTAPKRSTGAPKMCQRFLKVLIILHKMTAHHLLALDVSNSTTWIWCASLQAYFTGTVRSAKHVMVS